MKNQDPNIKINTVFNGEFVAGDKRANKNIATRNYELFHSSDLQEWYERRRTYFNIAEGISETR